MPEISYWGGNGFAAIGLFFQACSQLNKDWRTVYRYWVDNWEKEGSPHQPPGLFRMTERRLQRYYASFGVLRKMLGRMLLFMHDVIDLALFWGTLCFHCQWD